MTYILDLLIARGIMPSEHIEDQDEEEDVNDEIKITKVRRSGRIRHLEEEREADDDRERAGDDGDGNVIGLDESDSEVDEEDDEEVEEEVEEEEEDVYVLGDDEDEDEDDFRLSTRAAKATAVVKELAALQDSDTFVQKEPASASPKKQQPPRSEDGASQTNSLAKPTSQSTMELEAPGRPTSPVKETGVRTENQLSSPTKIELSNDDELGYPPEEPPSSQVSSTSVKREPSDSDSDEDGFNAEERAEFLRLQVNLLLCRMTLSDLLLSERMQNMNRGRINEERSM